MEYCLRRARGNCKDVNVLSGSSITCKLLVTQRIFRNRLYGYIASLTIIVYVFYLSREYLEDGHNFYFCSWSFLFSPDFLGQGAEEVWHRDGRFIMILLLHHAGLLCL